jgi:hypothetical protein
VVVRDDCLDHGWTQEFAVRVNGASYGFAAHAWSWNGDFDPFILRKFIAENPGQILHFGDPVRPDQRESSE